MNRDCKKHGVLDWWTFMPRWAIKYKHQQQVDREEGLKQYLIALAQTQNDTVQ